MSFTKHNNLEVPDTGTQNWDTSVNENFSMLEDGLTIKATAGLTISPSEVTYIDSGGEFQLAIADGTVANRYIGIATTVIDQDVDGYCRTSGHYLDADWAWTVGDPVFLSDATPGTLTQTEPGESIIIGVAIATNEITIRPWIEPNLDDVAVIAGGTGRSSATPYAVVCGGTNSTAELQSVAGLGTSGQVLKSNGADALPTFQTQAGAGTLIQTVIGMTGEYATGTGSFNTADAIPQNTEGDEYMTLAITPTDVSNTLLVNVHIEGTGTTANSYYSCALFMDDVADALSITQVDRNNVSGHWGSGGLIYPMVAGTTSEIIFKVRAGNPGGATFYFNGSPTARTMGGKLASGIIIQEVE